MGANLRPLRRPCGAGPGLDAGFGRAYGVLIEELRLLARAVFVVAPDGTLAYSQLVPEMTSEPDYAAVLAAVKALA